MGRIIGLTFPEAEEVKAPPQEKEEKREEAPKKKQKTKTEG